jgi:hypothetical protein
MLRGEISDKNYKPQFSGHATFPMRYGWLKKATDAVAENNNTSGNKSIFLDENAIARFGVGKNMVESIRHWAEVSKIIEDGDNDNSLKLTPLGKEIFSINGLDPYLENISTLWLLHWNLCSLPTKTTWHWVFNHFTGTTFDRENILKSLIKLCDEAEWKKVSPNTIKRDVECFVRTYVARKIRKKEAYEDGLESPLVELGLIRPFNTKDTFRLVRGPKNLLPKGIFIYSVLDFWKRYTQTQNLSFESLMYEPGSPGRVYLLDENDLAGRLSKLEEQTDGLVRWSETAGLKQLVTNTSVDEIIPHNFLLLDYDTDITKDNQ